MSIKCPRDGKINKSSANYCVACGYKFNKTSKVIINIFNPIIRLLSSFELKGRVINIKEYNQQEDFKWNKIIFSLIILLLLIVSFKYIIILLIFILIFVGLFYICLRLIGISINLFNMLYLLSMFKFSSLNISQRNILVRDVIIQVSNESHLIRIKGHLKIGAISMGDVITVKGREKEGMFIFNTGHNHTTNCALKLK